MGQLLLDHYLPMEAQTKNTPWMYNGRTKDEPWINHGRRFYQETFAKLQGLDANSLEVQAGMALRTAFDFCSWSPVPWTSDVPESEYEIASKIRQFAAFTLQTEWDKQVIDSLDAFTQMSRRQQPTPLESPSRAPA